MLIAGVLLGSVAAQAQPETEQRLIRDIRITVEPIFSAEEAAGSSLRTWVNRHHRPTRDRVLRRALLFSEGDLVDKELLEASERDLRKFKFINKADIEAVPVDDTYVDIEVTVQDAWALEPGANIEGGGGLSTITLHLIHFNILGTGKKAYVEAKDESDVGTTWKLGYSDYQLFGSRWIGNTTYQNGPLVESIYAQASLPLYSPDSEWAYGGSVFAMDQIERLFEDGQESSRFRNEQTMARFFLKRSFGPRYQKTKLDLSVKYLKKDFSSLGDQTTQPPPPDQENVTPTVGITKENIGWSSTTFINKMGRVEDFSTGHTYGAEGGWGIPIGDSQELYKARLFYLNNVPLGDAEKHLLKLSVVADSEIVRNTFLALNAKLYRRFSKHTLAVHYLAKLGYELDASRQFQLGADSGLRGYPARSFTGERLMLLNIEDRQYWGTRTIGLEFDLGTVVFIDAGNVWKEEDSFDFADLNWSAGIGLRIGLNRMPQSPILRVDYGWALGENSGSEFTIGMEQQF